jgi:hypothetical protein
MAVQGERMAGGFILITGIDGTATRLDSSRPWPLSVTPMSAMTRRSCSYTVGTSYGSCAHPTKCWHGLHGAEKAAVMTRS